MVKNLFGLLLLGAVVLVSSCCKTEYKFDRAHLDKYVEVTTQSKVLGDGAAVYFDMSNGMNFAYADDNSKAVLQSVVNSVAGKAECFGLAKGEITPIEKSHTEI